MKICVCTLAAVLCGAALAEVPFGIGIAGFTFRKKGVDETIAAMKALDMHALCVKSRHLKLDCTQEEADAFKAKLAAADIVPVGVGPIYADSEEEARKGFEQAKKLGVRVVVGVPLDHETINGKKTAVESDRMLDVIDRLVKEYDMTYAIHNHGPDMPRLYPTAEAALKRIGDRDTRIGVCLDIGHEYRFGIDPAVFIRAHGDRIYDVHIKNIKGAERDKKGMLPNKAVPAPRGVLDIPAIFTTLAEVGYSGWCNIEYERDFEDNLPGLLESVGYYRGVADAIRTREKASVLP